MMIYSPNRSNQIPARRPNSIWPKAKILKHSPTLDCTDGYNKMERKQVDYLDADEAIRGQGYACLSFLCPEQFLPEKQAFFAHRFVAGLGDEVKLLLDNIEPMCGPDQRDMLRRIRENHCYLWDHAEAQDKFRAFVNINSADLEEDFHQANGHANTMRGIKIRGVYPTLDEARDRARLLTVKDPKHNVWVGEVGTWLPLSDNPESVKDAVYAEASLNDLMRRYNENASQKQEHFDRRKNAATEGTAGSNLEQDPWMQAKLL